MDKPEIIEREDGVDYNIWYNTYDPDFIEINLKSFVPYKWMAYPPVANGIYKDSILKPINRYVEQLCPAPSLVSIENNVVTLRQGNHAEMYLLHGDGEFYNVDRPHLRQYYQTKVELPVDDDCYEEIYKLYVPWFIDANVQVLFKPVDGSPFRSYQTVGVFYRTDPRQEFVKPIMIPFAFRKVGEHMVEENYGRIKRQSPMFDMVFEADDIMVAKIRKFYEERN